MSGVDTRHVGTIEFAREAAHQRAATYRERAAHLFEMAARDPTNRFRSALLELAYQFEGLAIGTEQED